MQGEEGDFYALVFQPLQQLGCKMQSGGGGGNGPFAVGIDGLVGMTVVGIVVPSDVRRQRHMADGFQDLIQGSRTVEGDLAGAFVDGRHRGDQAAIEKHTAARHGPFGCPDQAGVYLSGRIPHRVEDQNLHLAAALLAAQQAAGNHPGYR